MWLGGPLLGTPKLYGYTHDSLDADSMVRIRSSLATEPLGEESLVYSKEFSELGLGELLSGPEPLQPADGLHIGRP